MFEETGEQNYSILLYDQATGGAGFVAQAGEHLPELLRRARRTLMCPRKCDRACHACLISYDTHRHLKDLDRHQALAVLTVDFLAALELPIEDQLFGPTDADGTRADCVGNPEDTPRRRLDQAAH